MASVWWKLMIVAFAVMAADAAAVDGITYSSTFGRSIAASRKSS
jgi:hypothetical protein